MNEIVYFGRPVDTFNDGQLFELLTLAILRFFNTKIEIIDPGLQVHHEGYLRHKKEHGYGMRYYFDEVLPDATVGVFLPFPDGTIGAGVWAEAEFLANRGCLVYEIDREGNITHFNFDESRRLSVEQTRAKLNKK